MALQAPNTRLDPRRPYGLEERIRELMAQRGMEPAEKPVDELAPFRTDETQRIVREGQREAPVELQARTPTADEIVFGEEIKTPPVRPFPKTGVEMASDSREGPRLTGPDGTDTVRDAPPPEDRAPELPSSLEKQLRPRAINVPLPGDQNAGKIRRALESLRANAESAKEDKALEDAGLVDSRGLPVREKIAERGRNLFGVDIDDPLGENLPFAPAPGGVKDRKAGSPRRIGATPEEMAVPLTDRNLPDSRGNRAPALPGKGTFVDDGGTNRSRAPSQAIMEVLEKKGLLTPEPPSPERLLEWREGMIQAAVASGIDIEKYADKEALIRAGAEAVRKQVELKEKGWKTGITSTGEPVFKPGDAAKDQAKRMGDVANARKFITDFKPDEAAGALIMQLARDGKLDEMRAKMEELRDGRLAGTSQAAMDQGRLRGQTQQMNNPRINTAMLHDAIMKQPNARGVGQVLTAWSPVIGRQGAAAGGTMMMQADAQDATEREAAANRASAEKIANAKKDEDGLDNYMAKVNSVLVNSPDVITAINQLQTINAAASLSANPLVKPENVEYQTLSDVSRHWIRTGRGPDNMATKRGLQILYDKLLGDWAVVWTDKEKAEFFRRAEVELGVPQEFSRQWLAGGGR